jgi:hypothetical protein
MRLLSAFALSAAIAVGGCTYPDGSLDVPSTLALGAGAAIAGVAIAAASNQPRYTNNNYYYRPAPRPYYGRPYYGGGYGYRRW